MAQPTQSSRPAHGGNLVWAATVAGCSPHQILDFSASINPLGPPAGAIAALQAQLQGSMLGLRHYPDPRYIELRAAIAAFHTHQGEAIDPEWVLPGNGAAELLNWAARELATLGPTTLFTPAFGDYARSLQGFGGQVQPVPLNLQALDLQALTAHPQTSFPVAQPTPGYLINNPHNPTGQIWSRDAIAPYLDQADLVVVDEAFMDFLPPGQDQSLVSWVERYPNLVVVRSLTKFYSLPGLRLGYCIAQPQRLAQWQQWRDPWSVNRLAAAVGPVLLQAPTFQAQTWAWLTTQRSQLVQGLAAIPGLQPLPGAANFLLVQAPVNVTQLQEALLRSHQILIRDCLSFPELGDRWFRVAVRTEAENQRLLAAVTDCLTQIAA